VTAHRADLDAMREVVDALAARLGLLEELADRLAWDAARLAPTWDGEASSAHTMARTRWESGFAQMRAALADMRAAVRAAREHYEAAAEVNLARWRELG